MTLIIRILLGLIVLILAVKLIKGILGLLVGLAVAGLIFFTAKKLLTDRGTKRIDDGGGDE